MQDNRLLHWLSTRGITPNVIELFNITIDQHYEMGECIRIPIEDTGKSKYRRDPEQNIKPKYTSDAGLKASLYGWLQAKEHESVLVTEGELDTLVAWSNNVPAVSSSAGALTFNDEWIEWLSTKEVTLCFDNDHTGAEGMIKILMRLPQAKVVLIPQRPNIKDLTDYMQYGGNLHELLKTARHYTSLEQVKDERAARVSVFESVLFHDEYIEKLEPKVVPNSYEYPKKDNSKKEVAKTYPIGNLLKFQQKKACCIWHNEKTPSLTYYPKTNSVYCFGCGKHGDAIDVYRTINDCDFKTAVTELNKLV
jgi:DNA primase